MDGRHSDGSRAYSSDSSDYDSFGPRSVRRRYDTPSPSSPSISPSPSPDYSRGPNSYHKEDRISELPDLILIHILSLLPLIDAISTASLSKRWLFLWKMVPNLAFSHSDHLSKRQPSALVSFIDKALLLHERSPINKFSVQFDYGREFRSSVDVWLHVATGRNVEEINLGLRPNWCNPYTLPKNLFTNSSLLKLTLRKCHVKQNAVVSWPSLKTLSISYDDELNDDSIESILSGSPLLESLELRKCGGVGRLNTTSASLKKLVIYTCNVMQISAPKVESLSILGYTRRNMSMSLDLPSLLHATLDFEFRIETNSSKDFYKETGRLMTYLLDTVNGVEELTIGTWLIQVLSVMEMQNLTCPMSTCKHLILYTRFRRWDLPGIANLLLSSVSLETVVIIMKQQPGRREIVLREEDGYTKLYQIYEKLDDKYWNSQEGALVNSLQSFKTVKIIDDDLYITKYNNRHTERLLGLLEVILKNARMLEKLVICTSKSSNHGSLNSMEVAQRLLSFPKASPAVILYYKS